MLELGGYTVTDDSGKPYTLSPAVCKGSNLTKINESCSEWMVSETKKPDFEQLLYLNWPYSALIQISPVILSLLLENIISPQPTELR